MTTLLADIGGTNTRMALGSGGRLDAASVRSFRNEEFRDFQAVRMAYGHDHLALCIAIAGPVTGQAARLTNLDWHFDAGSFGVPTRILNDLQAVGHALGHLPRGAVQTLREGHPQDGQRLVVGLGTGFNVSLAVGGDALRAEAGHATLPLAVADALMARLGKMPFATVEALFSGAGLREVHRLSTGEAWTTDRIIAEVPATLELFAESFGIMVSELVYQYMPLGGIVLNGGLARAVMGAPAGARAFDRGFRLDREVGQAFGAIPIGLITDDAAALYGCAALS